MNRLVTALLILSAAAAGAAAAETATLTVKIAGVTNKGGTLMVGVFDEAGFPKGNQSVAGRRVPATAGEMTVTLEQVPAGRFAVKVLQDFNSNGRMDFRFGLIPAEPFGFSNNPVIKMGPPSYQDVAIDIEPGSNHISIQLH